MTPLDDQGGFIYRGIYKTLLYNTFLSKLFCSKYSFFISFLLLKLTRSVSLIPTLNNLSQRKKLSNKHIGELLKVAYIFYR